MTESRHPTPDGDETNCHLPGSNQFSSEPAVKQPSASGPGTLEGRPSGFQKLLRKSFEIPKTMLDPEACKRVVSRLFTGQEAKANDVQDSKPAKPFISINEYKKSSKCPLKWDELTGSDRIRYCERCRLQVYNFDKVELPEAEELIRKRENLDKFMFYKRSDGKFMTSSCPVGAAKESNLMFLASGALMCMVALFILANQGIQPQQSALVSTSQGVMQTTGAGAAKEPQAAQPARRTSLQKASAPVVQLPAVAGNNPYYHKDDDPGAQMQTGLPSGPPGKLPDVTAGANPLFHKEDDPKAQFATGSPHGPTGKLPDVIVRSSAGSAR